MDSDSPLPAKRLRPTINGNIQLTECVREFKLPRQFPSMIPKANANQSNDKNKIRVNLNAATTCFAKTPAKIVANQDNITAPNIIRKIKLKGKDGRDLGELKVQDLPPNIQGKTITLAKNGVNKSPDASATADKSKGITIGVLTPVNILKTDQFHSNNFISSPMCVNRNQKLIPDMTKDLTKKTVVIEQKQMSTATDQQGRPQVLVFQSGKNWHMVKIPNADAGQKGKTVAIGKLPMAPVCGKATVLQAKEQNVIVGGKEIIQSGCEKAQADRKVFATNPFGTNVKRWPQRDGPDVSVERHTTKSPNTTDNRESGSKIKISRVSGPAICNPISQAQPISLIHAEFGSAAEKSYKHQLTSKQLPRNNASLRQDVMVVLPSAIPTSLESSNTLLVEQGNCQDKDTKKRSHFTREKSGKTLENSNTLASGDFPSTWTTPKKQTADSDTKDDKVLSRLDILTKALSTVVDKELRAKALKALADCGIGIERLVPILPESKQRPVKDSDTQTAVFGIVEPEHFVYVTPENPSVERIRPIERKAIQQGGFIVGNPHPQELSLTNVDQIDWMTPKTCNDLTAIVEGYLYGNEGATEVRNIFTKPKSVPNKLISQLEEDFQFYNKYDENGLLNIHKAVVANDLRAVTRLLKVLKACNESPDLPTADGETSLELAVRYEVSPKIIKMLLDSGAEPTSMEPGHDSALIIASKKSLPILTDLIPYVNSRKSLDNYDSLGFAALHYCAQYDNKVGVRELAQASADINVRDRRSGRTPLFHAIENEHIELAQLLLEKGAQPNIACYSGHTVFALVEDDKHYSLAESLNRAGK